MGVAPMVAIADVSYLACNISNYLSNNFRAFTKKCTIDLLYYNKETHHDKILYSRVGPFFQPYFAHLLFCRTHFPDSHGMFLFAYNFQEPSGICIFLTSNFYI